MIKIAVAGANGRMGQLLVEAINNDQDSTLSATLVRSQSPQSILDSLSSPIDVMIDFTSPAATLEHIALAKERTLNMVIGTTGFSESEKKIIHEAAKVIPIVFSPNMSIGVNLSFGLIAMAAKALSNPMNMTNPLSITDSMNVTSSPLGMINPLSITISDIHHQHKKDAPSGTSLKMAEIITEEASGSNIQFFSERLGNVVGDHSVCFSLSGESLEITHKATDRSIFAKGALLAAKWVIHQKPGFYSMQDVLGL